MSKLLPARCPVCNNPVTSVFFDAGRHTLATLAWPRSREEALGLPRFPLSIMQCPECSHVFNKDFDYRNIPYADKPNLMYNDAAIWQGHLATVRELALAHLPASPMVVEIGCGNGHFLAGLAARRPGRYVGFDPHGPQGGSVEIRKELFEPFDHFDGLMPDMVVMRHVLEHLTEPDSLLVQLAWAAHNAGKGCLLLAEVPCIDRVFATRRLADFFYEHVSHFSTRSFTRLMQRAGTLVHLAHGYDSEVVYALVRLGVDPVSAETARDAVVREQVVRQDIDAIRAQLAALAASGRRVVIWGGTGKAAAFIHHYGADAERFPLVVDSDREKEGTYVPGAGQRIAYRDALKDSPPDVVIVPPHWRARDIVGEMRTAGIAFGQVLIEHEGKLVDFFADAHPYR